MLYLQIHNRHFTKYLLHKSTFIFIEIIRLLLVQETIQRLDKYFVYTIQLHQRENIYVFLSKFLKQHM